MTCGYDTCPEHGPGSGLSQAAAQYMARVRIRFGYFGCCMFGPIHMLSNYKGSAGFRNHLCAVGKMEKISLWPFSFLGMC